MALDRWIAFVILCVSVVYAYAAFFTMDQLLPPFMQRNPIWPSTFPKVLSIMAIAASLIIVLGLEKAPDSDKEPDIDYRRLGDYELIPALTLLGLMVAYALLLRPAGFLLATSGFLIIGAVVLGERKLHILIPVACVATGFVWYLVEEVLGIFLRPLPFFF
ncbi:tripartite tricarboxylate transporter TctB family protein [Thalassococcus lentus]|uniref:Tripartite tricarboxylate transporter TctB family protein n=1 Tax=Thalassococcus lentus TaxID=1210524 RepID=A0ABT4XPS5_9RHOB|nr:tripartite tricarboxylate transporter TctB family protein [Thalassococcus lentus]MDA7423930.1 tripartite tricarboxylate transporter TctB family protein [Thalassococcus lentus]